MSVDEARAQELKGEYCSVMGWMDDNTHYSKYIARLNERKEHLRESWVRTMEAKIVRDQLTKCYRVEGVNNNEKCKFLAERYVQMIEQNRVCHAFFLPTALVSNTLVGPRLQKD